jgi:hypothetical protein
MLADPLLIYFTSSSPERAGDRILVYLFAQGAVSHALRSGILY